MGACSLAGLRPNDGVPRTGAARVEAPTRPKSISASGETRSEEHTSELQSLMRISYAVFCLKKKNTREQIVLGSNHKHKDTTETSRSALVLSLYTRASHMYRKK